MPTSWFVFFLFLLFLSYSSFNSFYTLYARILTTYPNQVNCLSSIIFSIKHFQLISYGLIYYSSQKSQLYYSKLLVLLLNVPYIYMLAAILLCWIKINSKNKLNIAFGLKKRFKNTGISERKQFLIMKIEPK